MTAVFAHRGCHGVPAPRENTIEAFLAAARAGADGVELDVRATADGALAVHHDRHVPGAGETTNVSAAQLPVDVPLLADALDACGGLQVNVEIKGGPEEAVLVGRFLLGRGLLGRGHDGTGPLGRGLHGTGPLGRGLQPEQGVAGPAGVFVSSFLPESIAAFREVCPGIPAGFLVDWRTDAMAGLRSAAELGCATYHPFVTQVDASLVDAARSAGLGLHVWTVNADDDIDNMGRLGVEAVITDRVEAALRILRPAGTPGAPGEPGE